MKLHDLAYAHNEIARTYRPDDAAILQNKAYLEPLVSRRQDSASDSKEAG